MKDKCSYEPSPKAGGEQVKLFNKSFGGNHPLQWLHEMYQIGFKAIISSGFLEGGCEACSQMKSGVVVNLCKVIPLKMERVSVSKGAPNIHAGQGRSRGKCSSCIRVAGAGGAPQTSSVPQEHHSTQHVSPKKAHSRNSFLSPSRLVLSCHC